MHRGSIQWKWEDSGASVARYATILAMPHKPIHGVITPTVTALTPSGDVILCGLLRNCPAILMTLPVNSAAQPFRVSSG